MWYILHNLDGDLYPRQVTEYGAQNSMTTHHLLQCSFKALNNDITAYLDQALDH
jgi:hypothetical protein